MSKRGNGEGSIYERQDGRYAASITVAYIDGKPKRKTVYGRTRAEVADRLNKLLTAQAAGLPPADDRLTVGKFLEDWLENTAKPKLRPVPFASYSMYVRRHIVPTLGKTKLTKLTPQAVEALLAEKLRSGLSPRSVNHIRAVLRTALNRALAWGLVTRNAAALATPPRVTKTETPVLTPEQAAAFVAGIATDRLGSLFILALTTGLRLGEATGLAWSDIDFESRSLRVRQAIQRIGGEFVFVEPKSHTSRRTLAIPDITLAYLKERRTRQREDRLAAGPEWEDNGLVFTTEFGRPLNPSSTTRHLRQQLKRLELPPMRFHDLRHACASLLLAKGVHPRLVMETLGHSQISLTMNTYSHVIPALQREVAAQMDSVFAPAG